ncbi:MAG: carboxypeptidase-like regulatory domain-containing protein, partial [Candidatus Acidiferrales bacterium]
MRDKLIRNRTIAVILCCSFVAAVIAIAGSEARPQPKSADVKTESHRMAPPSAGSISGAVTSAQGPEAGVWVIAETLDLGTKYRKIVVTDDRGRYLVPDLPKAKYKVWVRGYGLVDSDPVQASPGDTVALSAVVAPTAKAAAEYYPPDYW